MRRHNFDYTILLIIRNTYMKCMLCITSVSEVVYGGHVTSFVMLISLDLTLTKRRLQSPFGRLRL